MTSDQTTPGPKAGSEFPRRSGWDGGSGASWYSGLEEDMIAILVTQVLGQARPLNCGKGR
jgi:hypothetical protein